MAEEALHPVCSRGRDALRPTQITTRGWRDVLLRVWQQVSEDNVGLISAGVAFYALLAIFPALGALVSIYGLVADPTEAGLYIAEFPAIPADVRVLVAEQLRRIATSSGSALGWGLLGSLLLSIYSASRGINALISALNIAYEEHDHRGLIHRKLLSFGFTVGAIVLGAVALAIVVAAPVALQWLPLGAVVSRALTALPWILLAGGFLSGICLLYRYAPNRRPAQWRWVTPGSVLATVLWLGASVGLSTYVGRFGDYNEVYGSVGAVVVLLLWFYLTAYIVVLGGELNAELEHQTRRDTTRGPERAMGERGAYVADTLGEIPPGPWKGDVEPDDA